MSDRLPTGFQAVEPYVLTVIKRLYEDGEYIEFNPDARVKTRNASQYRIRANCGTVRLCSATVVARAAREGLIKRNHQHVYKLTVFGIVAARTGFSFLGFAYGLPPEEIASVAAHLLSSPNPRVYAAKLSAHARHRCNGEQPETLPHRSSDRSTSVPCSRPIEAPDRTGLVPLAPRPQSHGSGGSGLSRSSESWRETR